MSLFFYNNQFPLCSSAHTLRSHSILHPNIVYQVGLQPSPGTIIHPLYFPPDGPTQKDLTTIAVYSQKWHGALCLRTQDEDHLGRDAGARKAFVLNCCPRALTTLTKVGRGCLLEPCSEAYYIYHSTFSGVNRGSKRMERDQ